MPSPLAAPPAPVTQFPDFPGPHAMGKASVYRIYAGYDTQAHKRIMEVLPVLDNPHLRDPKPLAGATIVYPGGEKQKSNAAGVFDASKSAYARIHGATPADPGEITVTVRPGSGSGLMPQTISLLVLAPSVEGSAMSGSVPAQDPNPVKPGAQAISNEGYLWSCDPKSYRYHVLDPYVFFKTVEASTLFSTQGRHAWYYGQIYRCETDQPDRDITVLANDWWQGGPLGPVHWTIRYRLENTSPSKELRFDAVWAAPNVYGAGAYNEHLELICPIYVTDPSQKIKGCGNLV